MKKLLFVFNPHAGKGLIKNKLLNIVDELTRGGYEVTLYPTQHALDGYDHVCDADGQYDLIVCSGGDGTLNEVISAAMTHQVKKPVIGYIPAGSTNDFAGSLGIPKDMIAAARMIANGQIFSCDLGKLNGRYFNYVAAFGLFTDVSYKTPQSMKNAIGHNAYILESIKRLTKIQSYSLKVTFNGNTITGKYIYGMVANSKSVGGIKGITGSSVVMDDGMFEVSLIREPKNPIELQQAVSGLFSKNKENHMVERYKTNHIIFESDNSIAWTVDGENGDIHQRVEISVINKAISIVVPGDNRKYISI